MIDNSLLWHNFKIMITDHLSDDLLSPNFRKLKKENSHLSDNFGHCYVASEAAYYLLGGKNEGWKSCHINHESSPHWYLQHKSGFILDLTSDQFQTPIDYDFGRGKGFLTKTPCQRTKKLLSRISKNLHLYGI